MNVLSLFEKWGIDFAVRGDELITRCPFHEDDTPSCFVNPEKQVFKCHGCGKSGDVTTFLAGSFRTTREIIEQQLDKDQPKRQKTISETVIRTYHSNIWEAKFLLTELKKRGISAETIRQFRLGECNGRITIPIFDEDGRIVNVRRYLPGDPIRKMLNTRGMDSKRLYPIDQLRYDKIILCGGEIKALAVLERLNQHNIGAISHTMGETNWTTLFNEKFKGKTVFLCYDIDVAGRTGAITVARSLQNFANWIGIIDLPLDPAVYPTGDVNDYFGVEGKSTEEFLEILNRVPRWAEITEEDTVKVESIDFARAFDAKYTAKRIKFSASVVAMDTVPYVVTKSVQAYCTRDQSLCHVCPLYPRKNGEESQISPVSLSLLEMVGSNSATQTEAIRRSLKVPKCKVVRFVPTEFYNVSEYRLSSNLEVINTESTQITQTGFFVGNQLELNESYEFCGKMYPHPRNQQSVILMDSAEPTTEALDTFQVNEDILSIFHPSHWTEEGIEEKLNHIYHDLSVNVTRIYNRKLLHLMMDLAFHSALILPNDIKGWTEILVVGDSAQGKSETINKLMKHYKVGTKIECKNASVAGLLGGLQQIGTRWFVSWGIIPMNDRRLVVLEELKGAPVEVISRLTDMRSSGIAEIPKIERRRTFARTRLIAISNPRSDQPMSTYSYGINAIKELVGSPEDVRRFDACLILDRSEANTTKPPAIPHVYDSEACSNCVIHAWTRKPGDLSFESFDLVIQRAKELCEQFTDTIPIVDRGSMHHKLARLSAALSLRLGSCFVRTCVVDYVFTLLKSVYSSRSFGYTEYTKMVHETTSLKDEKEIEVRIRNMR